MNTRNFLIASTLLIGTFIHLSCGGDGDEESDLPTTRFNVYYVDKRGNDNNDGLTVEEAFRTVNRAAKTLQPGDTVRIQAGVYNEDITLEGVGSAEAPILISGTGSKVILDGDKKLNIGFWCEQCTNITFENLEIRRYTDIGIGTFFSSGITMRNLNVHDNGTDAQLDDWEIEGYGIHVDESKQITIENNEVYRNGPQPQKPGRLMGTGINTYMITDSTIRNNRSYDNIGGGILVEDSVNVLVENNEIFGNDLDATAEEWWDGGLWLDGGQNITVRNNTFRNNKGPGIEISDEEHQKPSGYLLENNIITGNYFGIYIWNFGTSDLPPTDILRMVNNQIADNTQQDVWVVPWNCPPPDACD
jgi:parallel beta-helix repeat protein